VDFDDAPGFEVGERVTFIPYFSCGSCIACRNGNMNCCASVRVCGVHIDGGMTEHIQVPSSSLVHGHDLGFDELALIEPLSIGAHAIRRAGVKKGEFVLVVGAGPIGLAAMAFAGIAGAEVIALDINEKRLNFCLGNGLAGKTFNALNPDVTSWLSGVTNGDMPSVVIDATGNLKAINTGFGYVAHGGRYILLGLQGQEICFSHPEFHKREGTLMSSRNATRADFEYVVNCIRSGKVKPADFITHRTDFHQVKDHFDSWLDPASGVIKSMISIPDDIML
jgi:2-desacetyl-2-hydroxyethyl bacteriochlorophyllide A dehydrogenase